MADVLKMPFFRRLRAEPNQHILHYRGGHLKRSGPGLAYWFNPLSAAIAQVPVEDCETTFLLKERSSDFQEVNVQTTIIYRISDPERAAKRINFTISLDNGLWVERPIERLASFWSQWAQQAVRSYLTSVPVMDAVRSGAEVMRENLKASLKGNEDIVAMGLSLVTIQVNRVSPSAEMEKAFQTPTREAIQQKADEAVFQRRALAVEKERAIKENELATQIELVRQQEELIRREGANKLLATQQAADSERAKIEAEAQRQEIAAQAEARDARIRAEGQAEAHRLVSGAEIDAEARRISLWKDTPSQVAAGLALQRFAEKIQGIQHLNITPELVAQSFQQFFRNQAEK